MPAPAIEPLPLSAWGTAPGKRLTPLPDAESGWYRFTVRVERSAE